MPTDTQTPQEEYRTRLPAVFAYRAEATRRRAAAFCDAPESVCAVPVQPLTPRTFSMLLAMGNRFICATAGETLEDVVDYLWLHAADYTHTGVQGWSVRKRAHLAPFMRQLTQPWRAGWRGAVWKLIRGRKAGSHVEHAAAVMVIAITEIRALVAEGFADTTAATGNPGAPIATLEAHFIHNMATAYGWDAERTRNTPLKQLFQLDRCQRRAAGDAVPDRGEQALMAAHLAARQAAIDAAQKDAS